VDLSRGLSNRDPMYNNDRQIIRKNVIRLEITLKRVVEFQIAK